MTLAKTQIVENLFAKNLFTKGESVQIIETLFELMKQALECGDDILISGFGKFLFGSSTSAKAEIPRLVNRCLYLPSRWSPSNAQAF